MVLRLLLSSFLGCSTHHAAYSVEGRATGIGQAECSYTLTRLRHLLQHLLALLKAKATSVCRPDFGNLLQCDGSRPPMPHDKPRASRSTLLDS